MLRHNGKNGRPEQSPELNRLIRTIRPRIATFSELEPELECVKVNNEIEEQLFYAKDRIARPEIEGHFFRSANRQNFVESDIISQAMNGD